MIDPNPVTIRPLNAQDAPAFQQIRLQAISDSPTSVWPTYAEEAQRSLDETALRIARTDTQLVVGAFDGTHLVGIAGMRREALQQVRHKATLWGVFISPEQRRDGLARTLITRLVDWARAQGVLQVHLYVNTENTRARDLYAALGFTTIGLEPDAMCVGGKYFDEDHMMLRLNP